MITNAAQGSLVLDFGSLHRILGIGSIGPVVAVGSSGSLL